MSAGAFESAAAARAFVAAAADGVAAIAPDALPAYFLRLASAYDEFPEIAQEAPRGALLDRLRRRAETLPAAQSLPVLLLCAAWDPVAPATSLFVEAARSDGAAGLLPILQLLSGHRPFTWQELAPAIDLLRDRGDADDAVAVLAAVLDLDIDREEEAGLGGALARLAAAAGTVDPQALADAALAARRRLRPSAAATPEPPAKLLERGARLAGLLSPPRPDPPGAPVAWPSGWFAFAEFIAQWPGFETFVPAGRLLATYAVPTGEGALSASEHAATPFCYGPYLKLPAGRHHIRIEGETSAGVDYTVCVTRSAGTGPVTVYAQELSSETPLSGVIAELVLDCDEPIYGFEVIVWVGTPAARFTVTGIRISSQQLCRGAAWPGTAIFVPANRLQTAYATATAKGMLTADEHDTDPEADPFCYGPYLTLPAGRHRIRLEGETGAGAVFTIRAAARQDGAEIELYEAQWSSEAPLSGVLAEFTFDCGEPIRAFEIVVHVDAAAVRFTIAGIRIGSQPLVVGPSRRIGPRASAEQPPG